MNNVGEVLDKLAAKRFDALIGVSGGVWLDAKESPYILDALKQKLELAKDVSALANSVEPVCRIGGNSQTGNDRATIGSLPESLTDSSGQGHSP